MTPVKKPLTKSPVQLRVITEHTEGQRLDNYLITQLKGVPKSHIYRILRKGEVRVNKKRAAASYRIKASDSIRIPPLVLPEKAEPVQASKTATDLLLASILYEDKNLLIINKPSGFAVHGGSTVKMGVVEILRQAFPKIPNLELAHRIDSDTSGCLILAKSKKILRELHELFRAGKIRKIYWALTKGQWKKETTRVEVSLHKHYEQGGKHVVSVSPQGKSAKTDFKPLKILHEASLVEVKLYTGRTHQIRVHATHSGHPIAGDDRYGDSAFNKFARKLGVKHLFLHARSLDFTLPSLTQHIKVVAPLDSELTKALERFEEA